MKPKDPQLCMQCNWIVWMSQRHAHHSWAHHPNTYIFSSCINPSTPNSTLTLWLKLLLIWDGSMSLWDKSNRVDSGVLRILMLTFPITYTVVSNIFNVAISFSTAAHRVMACLHVFISQNHSRDRYYNEHNWVRTFVTTVSLSVIIVLHTTVSIHWYSSCLIPSPQNVRWFYETIVLDKHFFFLLSGYSFCS